MVFSWIKYWLLWKILKKCTVAMLGGPCSQHGTGNTSRQNQPQSAIVVGMSLLLCLSVCLSTLWEFEYDATFCIAYRATQSATPTRRPLYFMRLNLKFYYRSCLYASRQMTPFHYNITMGAMASQITSLTIVYSTVYSDTDQIKHQRSASLAFVHEIHRSPVNSPHKWPVTRKMFPFDDVIMLRTIFSFTGIFEGCSFDTLQRMRWLLTSKNNEHLVSPYEVICYKWLRRVDNTSFQ